MSHTNDLVSYLRRYGLILANDNMYDELIQSKAERHEIGPAINIEPARLETELDLSAAWMIRRVVSEFAARNREGIVPNLIMRRLESELTENNKAGGSLGL